MGRERVAQRSETPLQFPYRPNNALPHMDPLNVALIQGLIRPQPRLPARIQVIQVDHLASGSVDISLNHRTRANSRRWAQLGQIPCTWPTVVRYSVFCIQKPGPSLRRMLLRRCTA